jgi:U4/U6.U5 tri-snRNP-associated protein 3
MISEERDTRRTTTPPVAFRVGPKGTSQPPESMDVDSKSRSKASRASELDVEDGEDGVVVEEEDPALAAMKAAMGFGGFGTTKQKKIAGNNVGAVRKEKKTEYRQYMNRVGGFNRPLDEI